MIKVYQIQLSEQDRAQLNREGWSSENPKIRAYGMRSVAGPEQVDMQFYTHVANVAADDCEEAFTLMNLWEREDLVKILDERVYSMSVGDVLEMEDGTRFLCASFGFEEI